MKKKNNYKLLPIIALLTIFSVTLGIGINRIIGVENTPTPDVEIFTPKGKLTSGYATFEEFSNDITTTDSDGMPNYINANDTAIDSGDSKSYSYCGNKNSKIYHRLSCSSIEKTKEDNKVYFSTKEECDNNGYKPCSRCKP